MYATRPTWASTLARAIWAVVEKKELKGIYHWSDAGVTSWYDFAVAIQEVGIKLGLVNRKVPINPITTANFPTTAKRPPYSVLNCWKSWADFEVGPLQWRVALRKMLEEKAKSGRYGSASEVVRDALRHMEERNDKLAALRLHLAEGEKQAKNEEYIKNFSISRLIKELDME